jgi:hypothetical protein
MPISSPRRRFCVPSTTQVVLISPISSTTGWVGEVLEMGQACLVTSGEVLFGDDWTSTIASRSAGSM